jgi:N12 class adenine-specific DNA methylase
MARRFQEITEVYRQEIAALARSDRWTAFLRSACRNYKLPFEEQVLVHAQRPDATAVLEIERWNRQFGRWVNKGATGIAVFDRDYPGRTRLKYYFDISDTHESRLSRPVPLWQVPAEQEPDVIEALENRFGALDDKGTLEEAIVSAMENAAADNMTDYLDDLQNCRDNSLLEELDELNLSVLYRRLLENSTAYMLMCRCGLEPDEYFDPEDFSEVFNFNTPETLNALGVATRDIAESGLSAIALTVRSRQKQIRTIAQAPGNEYPIDKQTETQTERSENHGTDIHDEGRLPAAGSAAAAGAGNSPWEIRPATPEVSEGAPEGAVHEPADIGQAERASGGDRPDGAAARGTDGDGDGSGRGRDGGAESRRPDEVGGADEQPEKRRRGDSAGGADLQLNTEPEEADSAEEATSELPAFLDEKKIFAIIENRNDDLIHKKAQIELFFRSHPDEAERAEYLRSAYQDRFTEILADGARLGYRPQKNGLLMWEGAYLSRTSETVFSWGLVAGFTAQLIDKREYYVNTEIKPFVPMESQQLTLFDMPAFDQPEDTPVAPLFSHPKLPQQIMDEALCVGANDEHSRLIICAYFMKDKPDNAAFLQKHYGENGAGFYFDGEKISLWYDAEGMRIARGSTAQRSNATLISWEEAAKRIRELLELGRYMPQSELDEVDHYERMRLADSIAYTSRDMTTEARNAGFLPLAMLAQSVKGGYPETQKQIYELLCAPDTLQKCVDEWTAFNAALDAGQDLLRFRFYRPKEILERLRDLQREPLHFTVADGFAPDRQFFISDDEIDEVLREGSGDTDYRLGVYAFYATHKDKTEREKYLKDYHGEYSGHCGGNDNLTHTRGKGIEFSHGSITAPYAKVTLKWPEAAKRIGELISQNKFLSDADWAAMPEYERKQLARKIVNFFMDTPDDVVRPFSQNAIADYWECVKAVTVQLSDADRVQEIYQNMLPAWEATKEEDRHYTLRKQGIEAMRAYLDGTYSVFGLGKTLQTPTTEAVSERPAAEPEVSEPEPPIAEAETSEIEPALPAEEKAVLTAPQPKRERMRFAPLYPEIPTGQRHDFHITDRELGVGSKAEKYASNVAAIRTLQAVESENRLATPEEQETLSCYVGWGGLADCFDEKHSRYAELKALLTEEEYAAARASSLTAFYTPPVLIDAIYQALAQMGLESGNLLEPACGIGNFMGMLPDSMRDCKVYGVELDSISGRIARQLYQNSRIAVTGYEKAEIPDSFFDAAVGNVPFGNIKVVDRRYDKHHWLIHDYFLGKTLDKIRPGGVIAFITSKGTMDKESPAVRKYLAQRADLIGAIRLPNTAFKASAGTDVTSDILFLQKRDRIVDIEPDWVHLDTDENGIRMNSYFVRHPEMVLGEMAMESTQYGMDSVCKPYENADLADLLSEAVSGLHAQIPTYEQDGPEEEEDLSIPADPNVRNYSFTSVDGKLYFRIDSRMEPVELPLTTENRVRGMMALRDCARQLIAYQMENHPDEIIWREQEKLGSLYDAYVKKYGRLCTRGNHLAFSDDGSYPLLCSLEVLDNEGNFARKADMFTKRTIRPNMPVAQVDTASEALAVSLSEKAQVDLAFMSERSGKSEEELVQELSGVIYQNIRCGLTPEEISPAQLDLAAYPYVTAEEFLSGNVRKKLQMVKALQAALPVEKKQELAGYAAALEAVQPPDLTAAEIGVRIGASWVPAEIYQQFMFELFGTSVYARQKMRVVRSEYSGEWNISNKSMDGGNIKAVTTYGTKRITAYHILEQTLNQRVVKVFDTVVEDGKERPVLNVKETAIAQDRQELIKSKFADWLWQDIDRRERLCRIYNDTFNSIRPREYDGSHLRFVGMNPEITLRKHQVNAIAHVIYGGNTLLAHEVGAGKTYEIVAAAMEMKRLGLCTKSLVVVPNHITEQWAAEWLQLYPAANILVATERDFEKRNRRRLCARIATGDYDAVIIGHSQLMKIPLSHERQREILQRQINEVLLAISDAKRQRAENFTIKQMERTRKSLETRLEKLNDQSTKDDTVTFEELGIDRLFIDESHNFKNLFLMTKMRNVGGIAQTEAQKSSDLFAKCQYLDELTNSHGVIFATGTPISNSMVELYTIQRYLQYGTLQEMGLVHFDDWASDFGETVTAIELAPEGSGYRPKTRFAKFFNLPELMATFKMVADVQTADMLNLPVPKANFHTEVIQPNELQRAVVAELAERAERVRARAVDPSTDNMLRITNDGRKLALDMRLINPLAADDPNGKVATCARNVARIWAQTKDQRSTQLVFCDLSTPNKNTPIEMQKNAEGVYEMIPDQFTDVYNDLKKKLVAEGIPEEEIAFIHDAKTEQKKKELFAKVRGGEVRILMGSTAKMGAGTNVQDRLIALHDLDCPWRPSDLQQRLGRIVRQGNQNPEVEIFRYVTEGTFDAYLYQLVESKQRFIAQIMTSKLPARAAEDVDETALSYAEIKALATGNPQIIEKCNLDMEVSKLNMLRASHLSQRYALEELVLRKYPAEIKELNERIAGYEQDSARLAEHPKPAEGIAPMVLNGVTYAERENAGKAIIHACTHMNGAETISVGSYRGFDMALAYDSKTNEFHMTLKGSLSHTAVLGADAGGNVTRIDNALEKINERLENARSQLAHATEQLENARTEMTAPFPREAELAEKTRRLNELNVLLNLNEPDRVVMSEEPDEGGSPRPRTADRER